MSVLVLQNTCFLITLNHFVHTKKSGSTVSELFDFIVLNYVINFFGIILVKVINFVFVFCVNYRLVQIGIQLKEHTIL